VEKYLQNAENDANMPLPSSIQKLKGVQLQRASPPWPSKQWLCPWTSLVARPILPLQTEGLRAGRVCPPHPTF